jgi:galactose mutarotase-like enzyme
MTEKENVVIAAGSCSVTLLPLLGGKIASIRVKDRELLQKPLAALGPRTQTMSFDASDASGWDECLPSVSACAVNTPTGAAEIPDHGDLWRVAWQPASTQNGSSITLRGECFSLPLALQRLIELTETDRGWHLRLDYTLTNTGDFATPWAWAAHPLFAVEAGDTVVLPSSITTARIEGSGGGRLGQANDSIAWPVAALAHGGQTDLQVVQSAQSGVGDKLFAGPLAPEENWCELHRPGAGLFIRVRFDSAATPYLGLWLCYCGWPERPGPKQNCVALEPTTAPVDSLAKPGPWSRTLSPGQSASWPMIVDIELI